MVLEIRSANPTHFSRQLYAASAIDRTVTDVREHCLLDTDICLIVTSDPLEMSQSMLSDHSILHLAIRNKVPHERD